MKPTVKIAETGTPGGVPVELLQHDGDFIIRVGRQNLMLSRSHESELELARIACARIAGRNAPVILIGGLGLGYTLRQVLDLSPAGASVIVAELLPEIVRWQREYLGGLTSHALEDARVTVHTGDVGEVIRQSHSRFDAVLLDVDNGPEAMTDAGNEALYSSAGIRACLNSLKPGGCLAVWSAVEDQSYEKRLRDETRHTQSISAPVHKGARSRRCRILVASIP